MKKQAATTKRVKQEMPLADFAIEALVANRQPMHVNALTNAMIALGWIPVGKKPSHVVYTNLFGLIQRKGDEAGIKLLGKGVFATERQAGGLGVEVKQTTYVGASGKRIALSTIPLSERDCGNCKNIEYTGIHELRLDGGTCAQDDKSQRFYCKNSSPACPYWEQRPISTIQKEARRQGVLKLTVLALNLSVARSRRTIG